MRSKTLTAIAVASTFGVSAGAFAGSGHEVTTPYSPNESGRNVVAQNNGPASMTAALAPRESIVETTGHHLRLSDASDWSASFEQMAEAQVSEVYLVGFAPMDSWNYYLIDVESGDAVAVIQEGAYVVIPADAS